MKEQKAIASSGRKGHANLSNLKRWMPAVQQAVWILDQCGYVTLSTIDGNGFPRPVAIDVLRHDGIATWMSYSGLTNGRTDLSPCQKDWIVERTFSWLENFRRLTIDYEYRADTHEAMLHIAAIKLFLNKI